MLRDDLTVVECRMNGLEFGAEYAQHPRTEFEVVLVKQLTALGERLAITDRNVEEAIAAFDLAAWDAWEIGHNSP